MGGVHRTAAAIANSVCNLLALCASCHDRTEHDESWAETEALGWRIPHWYAEHPREVPALIYTVNGHGWWRLTEEGGYRWADLDSAYRLDWSNPT